MTSFWWCEEPCQRVPPTSLKTSDSCHAPLAVGALALLIWVASSLTHFRGLLLLQWLSMTSGLTSDFSKSWNHHATSESLFRTKLKCLCRLITSPVYLWHSVQMESASFSLTLAQRRKVKRSGVWGSDYFSNTSVCLFSFLTSLSHICLVTDSP